MYSEDYETQLAHYPHVYDYLRSVAPMPVAELITRRAGVLVLEPGDATRYEMHFVQRPDLQWVVGTQWSSYVWSGRPIHPDYAMEKWGFRAPHTGLVVGAFLGELSHALGQVE